MCHYSKLGILEYPSSKLAWKRKSKKEYEKNYSIYGSVIIVITDKAIIETVGFEKNVNVDEINHKPATATY
jgi:hypothetical protein